MNELTINQMIYVLGWSYPTALKFAKQTGRQEAGRWMIPYTNIAGKVNEQVVEANKMQARLISITNGQ